MVSVYCVDFLDFLLFHIYGCRSYNEASLVRAVRRSYSHTQSLSDSAVSVYVSAVLLFFLTSEANDFYQEKDLCRDNTLFRFLDDGFTTEG